ncbi:38829_t:CDS:1 [Gigaspora margarita]|uniref:38829_t:CDS:1 n=1 Tax=Gigaspora margarita TaxID=4874 RepID=A0ABN7WA17_GIGMA|nr:38829_t:CDS:1 [Gigaspora margarita]
MTEADSNIGPAHQNFQENNNKIASLIDSMKKISILVNGRDTEVVCDSGSESPIIKIAKKLDLDKDKSSPNNEASAKAYIIDNTVSDIVKQVLGKKIWISLYRLLAIMKPEI